MPSSRVSGARRSAKTHREGHDPMEEGYCGMGYRKWENIGKRAVDVLNTGSYGRVRIDTSYFWKSVQFIEDRKKQNRSESTSCSIQKEYDVQDKERVEERA
ncbi:hypothetical protein Trydic_g19633 [Trypoxylus dichotomus]